MSLELSVVIVNYNVAYFLEQCLNSCLKAAEHAAIEILVIDNNSVDGSEEMMRDKFPQISYIMNKENLGFSKANNQGMRLAKGKYLLLLNPDTVVEEFTFRKTIDFMNTHPDAGGLGVRMLDGRGKFLPESKRGLPTPMVAFFKIFGLSSIFPKSRTFGRYHLGYLSEFETHEIEILSGAFMLMRKSVIDQIGLLDETFFMYGEDIDLSYRIILAGHKNYYFPETRIIHYKGESTKKSSVNYVFVFYKAMIIFANKHFSQNNAKLFSFLINSAVYLRAGLAIVKRLISKYILGISDFALIIISLFGLIKGFELFGKTVPLDVLQTVLPAYALVWLVALFFYGAYDRPISWVQVIKGIFIGTVAILTMYALLPKYYQFSRIFVLLSSFAVLSYLYISRHALNVISPNSKFINQTKDSVKIIVGSKNECDRVTAILRNMELNLSNIIMVSVSDVKEAYAVGVLSQLDEITRIYQADEVIFCAKDTSVEETISWMSKIADLGVSFKIAQPESSFIIGSNSIDHPGELYFTNITAISEKRHIRAKRTFDIVVSILLIVLFPITFLSFTKCKKPFSNIFSVLIGRMTLVGYTDNLNAVKQLPKLKKGVFSTSDQLKAMTQLTTEETHKLNLIYAKDYHWTKDLFILMKQFFN
jgi:GT2 family glycosyltransferase